MEMAMRQAVRIKKVTLMDHIGHQLDAAFEAVRGSCGARVGDDWFGMEAVREKGAVRVAEPKKLVRTLWSFGRVPVERALRLGLGGG